MSNKIRAEYLWIDGQRPTAKLRSKTKIIDPISKVKDIPRTRVEIPEWGFDGSSTMQATTKSSDCVLKPVMFVKDPIRGGDDILVMCEVFNADDKPHISNTRVKLRSLIKKYKNDFPLFGMEQEYTLFNANGTRPYQWPESYGYPEPQGKYYCGVGADEVRGRNLVEAHTKACIDSELAIAGTNAEVMPAQWEFQIGPVDPLAMGDQLWIARWLLYRLGEDFGITVKLYPKPEKGDWNGAGLHTNFSTKWTLADGGIKYILKACKKLNKNHEEHIKVYGAYNDERLTGKHETSSMTKFRYGVSDRGASVRIPWVTDKNKKGYLEDRRPAANADPYKVCTAILETVCGNGFTAPKDWIEIENKIYFKNKETAKKKK